MVSNNIQQNQINKITLTKLFFFPLYLVYVFLVSLILNLYVVPERVISLLVNIDIEWTIILWLILLLPAFGFFLILKSQKGNSIPLVSTVLGISIGIILSDIMIAPISAYLFINEGHKLNVWEATAEAIEYRTVARTCQNIIYTPSQSHLKRNLIGKAEQNSKLSTTALQTLKNDPISLTLIPSIEINYNSYFIDDTLYINTLDQDTYQTAGVSLTKAIISCNNQNRLKTEEPEFTLLTTNQYQEIRKLEILEEIEKLKITLKKLNTAIKDYEDWVKEGKNYYNQTKDSTILSYIKKGEKDIAELKEYKKLYEEIILNMETSTENVVLESGVFIPPNTIHVELIIDNPDYYSEHVISTMVHEYYHYISSVENKSYPSFFTEGLTEIANIDTKRANSIPITNHTYNYEVFLIRQIIKDTGYSEIYETYFNEDEKALIELLNETYGKDFYTSNKNSFDLISNLSSFDSFSIINNLLGAMGHELITREELASYTGYEYNDYKFDIGIKK